MASHYFTISLIVCMLACISLFPCTNGYQLEDAKRLLKNKTADYEKLFRPVKDQSKPLNVYTSFDLISIQEFDERQGKVTVTALLTTAWVDEVFNWDPDDYNGVTYLIIEQSKIWTPSMVLTNPMDEMDKLSEDWHQLVIYSSGIVSYQAGNIMSFSCDIDVTFYPWDKQACQLWFAAWGYASEQIRMIHLNDSIFQTYYSDNGEWDLTGSSTGYLRGTPTVFFELHLERRPRFIVVNVIAPIMFMSFLNVLIFLIPIESGERISYSLTVLLAIAVFLTLVGDNLPKTSDPMSLLSFYLLSVLAVSVLITLATIVSLRLYHADEKEPITAFWKFLVNCTSCRFNRRTKNKSRKYQKEQSKSNGYVSNGGPDMYDNVDFSKSKVWHTRDSLNGGDHVIYNPEAEMRKYRGNGRDDRSTWTQKDDEDEITWQDVSRAVDKVFLVVVFIMILALTLFFLIYTWTSGTGSDYSEVDFEE